MINALEWFKEKGFTWDDKITIKDVIDLQKDAQVELQSQLQSSQEQVRVLKDGITSILPLLENQVRMRIVKLLSSRPPAHGITDYQREKLELTSRIGFLEGALKGIQFQISDEELKKRIQDVLDNPNPSDAK